MTALVGLVWSAIPHRPANPLPSEATAPPPGEPGRRPEGLPARDEYAPRTVLPERFANAAQPEITFQIRQYPEDRQPRTRGDAIRVRLDIDRSRAHDLTSEDVMKALTVGCSFAGSPERVNPPPGVVYVTHLDSPERYEQFILKANAEGELVRLKDVAKVELLADREAHEAGPDAAPDRGGIK